MLQHRGLFDRIIGERVDLVHRRLILGVVSIVSIGAIENLGVSTALPLAERALGHLGLYGWVFSSFTLAMLVGGVVLGGIADRHRPTRSLTAGLLIFSLGLGTAGLAPSMLVVVVGRSIQGFGAGGSLVISYIVVNRYFGPAVRPKLLAIFATTWIVPSFIAPPLAGYVAQQTSWRLVILGIIPFTLAAGSVAFRSLRQIESQEEQAESKERDEPTIESLDPVDVDRSLVISGLIAASVSIGLALTIAGFSTHGTIRTLLLSVGLVVTMVSVALLVHRVTVLDRRSFVGTLLLRATISCAFFGIEPLLPLLLYRGKHLPIALAGLVLTSSSISWSGGSWLQGHRLGSLSTVQKVMLGTVLEAVGLVILMVDFLSPGLSGWYSELAWFLAGGGVGITYPAVTLLALGHAPLRSEGSISSVVQIFDAMGSSLGVGILGALVAASSVGSVAGTAYAAIGHRFALGVVGALGVLVLSFGLAVSLRRTSITS
ncbi:MAG: MFS transporter [Acidimicrobiales bacterium]